jgi:predicted DNA-binding transcriptional regulator YafY
MGNLTFEQYERIRQIDALIRAEQARTIAQIARDVQATPGAVQSALKTLRTRLGAPLTTDPLKGFVYLNNGWPLPPPPEESPIATVTAPLPAAQPAPAIPAAPASMIPAEPAPAIPVESALNLAAGPAPGIPAAFAPEIPAAPMASAQTGTLPSRSTSTAAPVAHVAPTTELLVLAARVDEMIRTGRAKSIVQMARGLTVGTDTVRRALALLVEEFQAPLVNDAQGFSYGDPGWVRPVALTEATAPQESAPVEPVAPPPAVVTGSLPGPPQPNPGRIAPDQLALVLQVDQLVRSERARSLAQLSRALSVGTDSAQRALAQLSDEFGAPVVQDPVRGFVYSDPQWRLPPMPLGIGELFVLVLGQRILASVAEAPLAMEVHSALTSLAERLADRTWVDLEAAQDALAVLGSLQPVSLHLWKTLAAVVQARQAVYVVWGAPGEVPQGIRIEPYLLFGHQGTRPYLIGRDAEGQALALALDAIRELRVLEATFEADPTFDPATAIARIDRREGEALRRVRVRFAPQAAALARARYWHRSQHFSEGDDGSLVLELQTDDLEAVRRWVMGYGRHALVEEPPELAALILREMMAMARIYSTGRSQGDQAQPELLPAGK